MHYILPVPCTLLFGNTRCKPLPYGRRADYPNIVHDHPSSAMTNYNQANLHNHFHPQSRRKPFSSPPSRQRAMATFPRCSTHQPTAIFTDPGSLYLEFDMNQSVYVQPPLSETSHFLFIHLLLHCQKVRYSSVKIM